MVGQRTDSLDGNDASPPGHQFVVRLWKEEMTGASEYRGIVRDVRTDAWKGFRDWSDLVAFMAGRLERADTDGGASVVASEGEK
ncbi:MAG TPA: hypothetical protein VGB64_11905 [Actinomycetota bacterium]